MRSSEDICLLCGESEAVKKNSHVIPAFMIKTLLQGDKFRRGYQLSTNKSHLETPFVQDAEKEDHLLCDECEQYFSVLETYCATRLHNRLWNIRFEKSFELKVNEGGVAWKICHEIDPYIFRLFLYSIIWRCSIGKTHATKQFKLLQEEEILLHDCLKRCIQTKQQELLDNLDQLKEFVPLVPFTIITCQEFNDRTRHLVFCKPDVRNPYFIILNEYVITFSFDMNELQKTFRELNNGKINDPIKIGFFSADFWIMLLKDNMEIFTKKAVEHLRNIGERPFTVKRDSNKF